MCRIVIAGSHDTKAAPLGILRDMLRSRGEDPIVIDTAVFAGDPSVTHSAVEVAAQGGFEHQDLASRGRAKAVTAMATGAAAIVRGLADKGDVGALVCLGGSNAATVFSHLAPVVPLGIPKFLMATTVAGDTRPFIGGSDVVMFYPVIDVDGDNALLRQMLERLSDMAVAAKSNRTLGNQIRSKKAVALSMYGVTTPCVQRASERLRAIGMEPFVFHANGPGGRSIEHFVAQGIVDGVIDATLAEIANELLGGAFPAGTNRMTSAALHGVPQVIAPGAIDMIAFGPRNSVPERFEDHKIAAHNELVTLVRTIPDECRAIGVQLAKRLGSPRSGTTVCIPLGGTSMMDKEGEVFHDPSAVRAFASGLRETVTAEVRVIDSDHNINDAEFADLLVSEFTQLMEGGG